MKPEQQRIVIAKACGWTRIENLGGLPPGKSSDAPSRAYADSDEGWVEIPDYLSDLNTMHEAEKVLTLDQQVQFSVELGKLTTAYLPASRAAWVDFTIAHATAAQRAEAFLRTLGLWIGD